MTEQERREKLLDRWNGDWDAALLDELFDEISEEFTENLQDICDHLMDYAYHPDATTQRRVLKAINAHFERCIENVKESESIRDNWIDQQMEAERMEEN